MTKMHVYIKRIKNIKEKEKKTNLRSITWEMVFQKALKIVLPLYKFLRQKVIHKNTDSLHSAGWLVVG